MAVTKTFIKVAENEAVIKVAGTAAGATISLATDLLGPNQVVNGATQIVDITGIVWSGAVGGIITITRNSAIIATLQTDNGNFMDFSGQVMPPENNQNTSDIVVTMSVAQGECWIKVRKVNGYVSKIEYGNFGSYDNPAVTGS
ncbi:hypothetical protein UFOVP58_119 [uncultured Caudovirales phage]|uniref:Uncharacterized protein n=1 Tax=uncultured Caudovirales phage TaxID=2100421 RepID=A0A6J5KWI0_9CAUD|nr:hypothetical protein UFOVP58_119 [uncultured Caudovirales phage]